VALAAPTQVSGTGAPLSYNVTFGYTGPFSATPRGLIPAATSAGTVADDPADNFVPGGPGTVAIPVTIAAGTTYARLLAVQQRRSTPRGQDLDLYLFKEQPPGQLVGAAAAGERRRRGGESRQSRCR
jgi:hypothetical protein